MAGGGRKSKVYVVGAEYCDSKPVKLATTQNVAVKLVESPNINVSDREKNTVLFEVNDTSSEHGIHKKYALLDNRYDKIILSLQDKVFSSHRRWKVFRGDSQDETELLFTAKQSKMTGSTEVLVFLATNKEEKTCDFKVRGSSEIIDSDSKIIAIDSDSKIIAKIGNDTVEVCPGVDRAFIVSLWIILYGMNQRRVKKRDAAKAIFQVISAVGVALGFSSI